MLSLYARRCERITIKSDRQSIPHNRLCMGARLSTDTYRVVVVGLDGGGKTTLLYRLKRGKYVRTRPSVGFNVETIHHTRSTTFTMWDVGGGESNRRLWPIYARQADALIFVVDSADATTIDEACMELQRLLKVVKLGKNVPIVVLANKQDLLDAVDVDTISSIFHSTLAPAKLLVLSCCAVSGEGLEHLLSLLSILIQKSRSN